MIFPRSTMISPFTNFQCSIPIFFDLWTLDNPLVSKESLFSSLSILLVTFSLCWFHLLSLNECWNTPVLTLWFFSFFYLHLFTWVSHLVSWLNTIHMLITPEFTLLTISSFWNWFLYSQLHTPCIWLIFNRQVKLNMLRIESLIFYLQLLHL